MIYFLALVTRIAPFPEREKQFSYIWHWGAYDGNSHSNRKKGQKAQEGDDEKNRKMYSFSAKRNFFLFPFVINFPFLWRELLLLCAGTNTLFIIY